MIFTPETNITALPAINYFAFYRQYSIYMAGAADYFQMSSTIKNELIWLLQKKDSPENIITKLENSKVGLLDALNMEARPIKALACLWREEIFEGKRIPVFCDVEDDNSLEKVALELYEQLNLPYFVLVTECGLIYNKLQKQLSKAYPKLFPIDNAPFLAAQDAIRRIDLDNENSLLEELTTIQTVFLQAYKPLPLISDEQDFKDEYWTQIFMLAAEAGFSQSDLKTNSISYFYSKLQKRNSGKKEE